jgi:hypothetical protein
MKDRIRDILIAIIGLIVFPLSLLIEVISWLFRSKKEQQERKKYKKIKKEIIKRNKKHRK